MTMTVPGEQQLTFDAKTPTEFRAMLGRILEGSTLSCGQIAIKTGMPRSTAYSLPDTKRQGLPSNPRQVVDFVLACGLTRTQVDLVMDRWTTLQQEIENTRSASTDKEDIGQTSPAKIELDTAGMVEGARIVASIKPQIFGARWPVLQTTSGADLLSFVLADEDRTRRAVRLMIPIAVLLVAVMALLVFLATAVPSAAPLVVAALVLPFLLYTIRILRGRKKGAKD